ncbi:MAG: hypothetical protein RRX92_09110 [Lachnospiraceae bacterium]
MTNLLVFREHIKSFYSKYEVYIMPALKFLMAFITLVLINQNLGYMTKINNIIIVLVIALMCSFLPANMSILVAAAFSLLHLYALSIESAAVVLAVYLLLFLLYFRFTPRDTLVVLLTPLCFMLKIPYLIPLAMGLIGTPVSTISVGSGVVVYYLLHNISKGATTLGASEAEGATIKFRYVLDGLIQNKTMLVTLVAFTATILVVYFIRRMSVDHAWSIAILAGTVLNGIIILLGTFLLDTEVSIPAVFIGIILSAGLAKILAFFAFNVDYTRTEMVQFEDDEYYYYVKAVPKITMATPEKRVKKINPQTRPGTTAQSRVRTQSQSRTHTTK